MDRSRLGRGLAILAVAALAVAVVSPAFSAAPVTKAKVKKIAKKQINKLVPGIAIEESELVRYGPITLGVGATQPVGTFGPFSFTASCLRIDDPGTPDPDPIDAEILIDTSEDNAAFDADDDSEDDFDAADPPEEWAQELGNDPDDLNDQDIASEDDGQAHAINQSGSTAIDGHTLIRVGSAGDADSGCTFWGYFLLS